MRWPWRHRQHPCDRAAAGAPGGPGGGLQPAQDPGDRRGQGQDRQGRRGSVGGAAGGRVPAVGVAARRPNPRAAPSGQLPRPHRAAADPAEEPGAVDPAPQPHPALPGRRPVRPQGPGVAGHPGPPPDELQAVGALLRQLDFHGQEPRIVDAELGRVGRERAEVRRLLTIPGVDATVALAIVAAVGDFGRFPSPQRLVSYLGLNPRVRQSGGQPAQHGRITKQGRAHARGMLVEAAWAAAKTPGPLRAFYERVRARRGMQVAVVATARKLATLCWHLVVGEQDYAFQRPSLTDKKLRALELRAGLPARRGQRGKAAAYSLKAVRRRERALTEQAEVAYRQLVAGWQPKPPAKQQPKRGVAATTGARR